jgi:hypothetical protein
MWTLALLIRRNRLGTSPSLLLREETVPIYGTLFFGNTKNRDQKSDNFFFCIFTQATNVKKTMKHELGITFNKTVVANSHIFLKKLKKLQREYSASW